MEAKQYAKMDIGGLFVIFEGNMPPVLPLLEDFEERKESREDDGDDRPLKFLISSSGILMA
jgi:hypothetical protein